MRKIWISLLLCGLFSGSAMADIPSFGPDGRRIYNRNRPQPPIGAWRPDMPPQQPVPAPNGETPPQDAPVSDPQPADAPNAEPNAAPQNQDAPDPLPKIEAPAIDPGDSELDEQPSPLLALGIILALSAISLGLIVKLKHKCNQTPT